MSYIPSLRSRYVAGGVLIGLLCLTGCSVSDLVGASDPDVGAPDPHLIENEAGAVGVYNGSIQLFQNAFAGFDVESYVMQSGLLSDELTYVYTSPGVSTPDYFAALDARATSQYEETSFGVNGGSVDRLYAEMNTFRSNASVAIGALKKYAPQSQDLQGRLYALMGYANILLADFYCSGIPLSTVDFGGDITLHRGSSTQQVYGSAIALFDTALTLATDSARFQNLAKVGKGRALLALGQYPKAAQAVAGVPDDFQYEAQYSATIQSTVLSGVPYVNFLYVDTIARPNGAMTSGRGSDRNLDVGNNEGQNGLDYVSANDPRVQTVPETGYSGQTLMVPTKYSRAGDSPIAVASGIEARLIEAEAALQAGDAQWLTLLNELRTTCTVTSSCPSPAPAGIGGVAGLPPLSDPGTLDARIDLLFRERAFWLFLTGARQGDMRRLVREYDRAPDVVYPTGTYANNPMIGSYGSDVDVGVPLAEQTKNPEYSGCQSRGA